LFLFTGGEVSPENYPVEILSFIAPLSSKLNSSVQEESSDNASTFLIECANLGKDLVTEPDYSDRSAVVNCSYNPQKF